MADDLPSLDIHTRTWHMAHIHPHTHNKGMNGQSLFKSLQLKKKEENCQKQKNKTGGEGERCRQKEGTAIGSKMGKNYACTYMGKWEEEVQNKAMEEMGKKPKMWYRFVDDIWGVWQGQEEFQRFVGICNGHEERIKVT